MDRVGRWLNHPWQWAGGTLFGLLVLTWAAIEPAMTPVIAMILCLEAVVGFLSGLVVWRMVVTGVQVWRLGKEFAVVPQLGHPDGCGGLEPLGTLCFKNALLPSITGVFLGAWLIIGPSTPYRYWAEYYGPLYSGLLLVPTVVALVSFLLPLWSVHRLMVTWAEDVSKQLDELGRRIAELAEAMLDGAKDLGPAAGAEQAKTLEVWRKFHKQHRHVPVWPFNSAIMVRFATAQVVSLLGLTGLGEPVVKVVTSVATSLGGGPK